MLEVHAQKFIKPLNSELFIQLNIFIFTFSKFQLKMIINFKLQAIDQ